MKRLIAIFILPCAVWAHAGPGVPSDNAFVGRAPLLQMPLPPISTAVAGVTQTISSAANLEPVPIVYTDNKSLFDALQVVAINNGKVALLRYPLSGNSSSTSSASVLAQEMRTLTVRHKGDVFLAGRVYGVDIKDEEVQLFVGKGKSRTLMWVGQLSGPRMVAVQPNQAEYSYTPPLSAGVGVGQQVGGVPASATGGTTQR